jgi:L-ascorbate metabolism protein UlaG (beta-lactamase superfamily)
MKKHWKSSLYAFLALLALSASLLLALAWQGMGEAATGARLARMQRSPQWHDGKFENPEVIENHLGDMLHGFLSISPDASPRGSVATMTVHPKSLRTPPASGLRVTWLGHATSLIEIDGTRVLTDPSWSERSSPISFLGPRRWFAPPIQLGALPKIDAIVISHDHYDHLDHRTIMAMRAWSSLFIVPLGVGAHLAYWGVPESQIVELDWWQHRQVGALDIVATPARHASGRSLWDRDRNLWAGYALLGPRHRVFFSGDTGLFSALHDIGRRFGPFDLTMIEVGQYHAGWPDWHIGPEQAVLAHQWLRGRVFLPIHWGKLQLAYHGWTEPIERVLEAAARSQVRVLAPMPGQSVEPELANEALKPWWPSLPWQRAAEAPIVSSRVELHDEASP